MENFSNETVDITRLPRFEQVSFLALKKSYWKVVLINLAIVFLLMAIGLGLALLKIKELVVYQLEISSAFGLFVVIFIFFSYVSYKKKGFAFREQDVLFKYGIIATSTIVIPYNRIQHVALHEGVISRYFGLAKIEIFTAGGRSSDIEIPGIQKEQAENIKQLLMGKIQKQL